MIDSVLKSFIVKSRSDAVNNVCISFNTKTTQLHSMILFIFTVIYVVLCSIVNLHQYADDCQLYLSTPPVSDAAAAVSKLSACLSG